MRTTITTTAAIEKEKYKTDKIQIFIITSFLRSISFCFMLSGCVTRLGSISLLIYV